MSDQKISIGLYPACGTMKNNLVGSASLDFSLLVATPSGTVSGVVVIHQALPLTPSEIHVHVTGRLRTIIGSPFTKYLTLTGTYMQPCTPPAKCYVNEKFEAYLFLHDNWDGTGGFEYANHVSENLTVTSHPCFSKA